MIKTTILYDFDDLAIEPEIISSVSSRSEVNPYDHSYFLPLFTAPMDTVINNDNQQEFYRRKIHTILPRVQETSEISFTPGKWISYSLEQFEELFLKTELRKTSAPIFALIDVANGHMKKLHNAIKEAKIRYPNLVIMAGNVAHPITYKLLSEAGADFIRVGIGGGNACSTSVHTGIHYPMASLIDSCYHIKKRYNLSKIVADGGMKSYVDIIKALSLGADYVMVGSIFNKALESAAETCVDIGGYHQPLNVYYELNSNDDNGNSNSLEETITFLLKQGVLYKKFRGMSTKEVQKEWGKDALRTSEGVIRWQKVEYTLDTWVENFTDYLRSSMSYTNSRTLQEFIGGVTLNVISNNAFKRFNK